MTDVQAQPDTPDRDETFSYTVNNLFSVIVEHPGWARPKVIDLLALNPQDVADTVHDLYGTSARAALITPCVVLVQAVASLPSSPVASLFWTATRDGAEQWTVATDRGDAARTHHQQTGHAANLVLPAQDLVDEVLRLNTLMEHHDSQLLVSPRLMQAA